MSGPGITITSAVTETITSICSSTCVSLLSFGREAKASALRGVSVLRDEIEHGAIEEFGLLPISGVT